MRVLRQVDDLNFIQFQVEVLVDRLENAADRDVVLELHGDDLVRQGLEETEKGKKKALSLVLRVVH